ncbi:MAG: four helix bundle protein [Calditrichia bacterium]
MTRLILTKRTKLFAYAVVRELAKMPGSTLSKHIYYQLTRSATSVAANYRAACLAHSKSAFAAKLSIVIEEADESVFWLEFIYDEALLKRDLIIPLIKEGQELTAIFVASRKTIQLNQKRGK